MLKGFNEGLIDAVSASAELDISRAQLYRLRTAYLRDKQGYVPDSSGGDRRGRWPDEVHAFLREFLPLKKPPNYQLVADELASRFGFKRARSSVEAYAKMHFASCLQQPEGKPRGHRRFRRAYVGELWQHDSSIHPWWPAANKQLLLLTCDDCSGLIVGGSFVEADTTWNHFMHFRRAFIRWGIPEVIYTDGLSLFGPSSLSDHDDPRSMFQRALSGLDIGHRVAPTPQAKGKIERRFGTLQNRLVTLLQYAKVKTWEQADEILQLEIQRQNDKISRSTGRAPMAIWQDQASSSKLRTCPDASLHDLHLSLRCTRRINRDHTIEFEGRSYEISTTKCRQATLVHHPNQQLWVVEGRPALAWTRILGHFTL